MNTPTHSPDNLLKEPHLMEQEINHTRERIGRTVEELEQRLSPGQLVDQALGYARDHGGHLAANVAGSIRRNPLPMLVTGLGVLWMLKSQSSHSGDDRADRGRTPYDDDFFDGAGTWAERSSTETSSTANGGNGGSRIAERLSGVGEAIKSRVAGARGGLSEAGESVGESVRSARDGLAGRSRDALGSARGATRAVRERIGGARQQARRTRDELGTLMEEQPLLMGAIGVAIGAVVAALVPATRREKEMMGKASDTVADKASEFASEGYQSLREAASETVDEFTRTLGRESEGAVGRDGTQGPIGDGKGLPGTDWQSSVKKEPASPSSGAAF